MSGTSVDCVVLLVTPDTAVPVAPVVCCYLCVPLYLYWCPVASLVWFTHFLNSRKCESADCCTSESATMAVSHTAAPALKKTRKVKHYCCSRFAAVTLRQFDCIVCELWKMEQTFFDWCRWSTLIRLMRKFQKVVFSFLCVSRIILVQFNFAFFTRHTVISNF